MPLISGGLRRSTIASSIAAIKPAGSSSGGGGSGPASALLMHFNGANALDIYDSSANAVAVPNTYGMQLNGSPGSSSVFGQKGLFSNSNTLVVSAPVPTVTATSPFYLIGNFTVDFWIYAASAGQYIISGDNVDYGTQVALGFFTDGRLCIWNSTGSNYNSTAFIGSANAASLSQSAPIHIAITRSGSTIRSFINGNLDMTRTYSPIIDFTRFATGSVFINGGPPQQASGSRAGACTLSELRIVRGTAVWTASFTPPTVPYTA